jgi:hypothetical protein
VYPPAKGGDEYVNTVLLVFVFQDQGWSYDYPKRLIKEHGENL